MDFKKDPPTKFKSIDDLTRKEAQARVEELGGRATTSVSSETDFVVAGEQPGSKYEEAKEQNIEILDEKQFEKLLSAED